MKNKILFGTILIGALFLTASLCRVWAKQTKENILSNNLFSFEMPENLNGTYEVIKSKDSIAIYDTYSKKKGFGGFAFEVKAFKSPSEYAEAPGVRKIGELKSKSKEIYDIVLIQPTDVQFDYENKNDKTYAPLYELGDKIDKEIKGKNKYEFILGSKINGEDIYKDIINKHKKAIIEKWDSKKLEKENMSYMYNVIAKSKKNPLDYIGYAFYDINEDGTEELVIGEIAQGNLKGVIYDLYTTVNRKPAHVISGDNKNRYYACDISFVCNEYAHSMGIVGMKVYILSGNSTELYPQVYFKYDEYKNHTQPWFISYNTFENKWENVSEKTYKERKAIFDKYIRFDFIPFGKLK